MIRNKILLKSGKSDFVEEIIKKISQEIIFII